MARGAIEATLNSVSIVRHLMVSGKIAEVPRTQRERARRAVSGAKVDEGFYMRIAGQSGGSIITDKIF